MSRPVSKDQAPAFPLRKAANYFAMSSDEELIQQSVAQILGTTPGERVMRGSFGCDIEALLFEPIDPVREALAEHLVREALTKWEPRVSTKKVSTRMVEDGTGEPKLVLEVRYEIKATGKEETFSDEWTLRR